MLSTVVKCKKELINIDNIKKIHLCYSDEMKKFTEDNGIKLPGIKSMKCMAYSVMSHFPDNYFDRDTCTSLYKKFEMPTRDSIQHFNKIEQDGFVKDLGKGKYCIKYPYEVSNKWKMRGGFEYNGSEESKNKIINQIKKDIQQDYIDIPNNLWQEGHKHPDNGDNDFNRNGVFQPPIQAKYKDRYIFFDTLTKTPTVKQHIRLLEKGKSPYTDEELKTWRNHLIKKFPL